LLASSAVASDEQNVTLEEAIAAYQAACEAATATAFDLNVTESLYRYFQPVSAADPNQTLQALSEPKLDSTKKSRQFFQDGKYCVELLDQDGRRIATRAALVVWDKEKEKLFTQADRSGLIRPYTTTMPSPFATNYLTLFMLCDGHVTFSEMLRKRADKATIEQENGLIVLSSMPDPSRNEHYCKFGFRLRLDPAAGFLPRRIDFYMQTKPDEKLLHALSSENELMQFESGVWLPSKTRQTIYLTMQSPAAAAFFGRPSGHRDIVVDLAHSSFDAQVPPDVFKLEFPTGTQVYDQVRQVTYRAGADSRQHYLKSMAKAGALGIEELKRSNPRMTLATVDSRSGSAWLWAGIIFGAVTVAAFLLWSFRKIRAA
jgi:hypothetical protein